MQPISTKFNARCNVRYIFVSHNAVLRQNELKKKKKKQIQIFHSSLLSADLSFCIINLPHQKL